MDRGIVGLNNAAAKIKHISDISKLSGRNVPKGSPLFRYRQNLGQNDDFLIKMRQNWIAIFAEF